MKRVLAAAVTGTMLFAMGAQAVAAPSVTGGGAQPGEVPAELVKDLEGVVVEPLEQGTVVWDELNRENYSEEELEIIDSLNNADADVTVKEAFGDLVELAEMKLFVDNEEVLDVDVEKLLEDMYFLSPVWELTFDGIEPTKENPVICTFTANNMTEDMEVYMLYGCEEDGWELLNSEKAAENQVKVSVHSGNAPAALVYRLADETADEAAGTSPVAAEETESETEQ